MRTGGVSMGVRREDPLATGLVLGSFPAFVWRPGVAAAATSPPVVVVIVVVVVVVVVVVAAVAGVGGDEGAGGGEGDPPLTGVGDFESSILDCSCSSSSSPASCPFVGGSTGS